MGGSTALEFGEKVLQNFWDLASADAADRERAAAALVQEVCAVEQKQQASSSDGGGSDASSALLTYTLRRLVRGLGSGRDGARQGFATALAQLLSELPRGCGPTFSQLLELGEQHLITKGGLKKTELRDALLGRVFLVAAAIRGGRVAPIPGAPNGLEDGSNVLGDGWNVLEDARMAADALVCVARSKPFLQEAAAGTMVQLLDAVDDATAAALVEDGSCPMRQWLTGDTTAGSPEALLVALHLWGRLPGQLAAAALPQLPSAGVPPPPPRYVSMPRQQKLEAAPLAVAAASAFFTREHLRSLLPAFRLSSGSTPRLHSVWAALLALLVPGYTADREEGAAAAAVGGEAPPQGAVLEDRPQLEALWGGVVEAELLSSGSHERKYLSLQLFGRLLPHVSPALLPVLLSRQLLRCLAANAGAPGNYLHVAAARCLRSLAGHVSRGGDNNSVEARVAVAVALQRSGAPLLAALQKVDASVAQAVSDLDSDCVALYILQLRAELAAAAAAAAAAAEPVQQQAGGSPGEGTGKEGEEEEEGERGGGGGCGWAVEQLYGALRMKGVTPAMRADVARFLAANAFFEAADPTATAASLAAATGPKKGGGKKRKAGAPASPAAEDSGGQVVTGLPSETRQLCAARLLSLVDSMHKAEQAAQHAKRRQRQQQRGKKGAANAAVTDATTADGEAEAGGNGSFLEVVCRHVTDLVDGGAVVPARSGAAPGGSEGLLARLQRLRDLEQQAGEEGAAGAAGGGRGSPALLHLCRLLQLYCLADPEGLQDDLLDQLGAVVAADKSGQPDYAEMARAAARAGGEQDKEEGDDDDEEEGGDKEAPWADQMLDVLLSLLAQGGSGAAGGLPSAPLRDAVEGAFRSHCLHLTPAGLGDLLRIVGQVDRQGGAGELLEDGDEDDDEGASDMSEEEEGGSSSGSEEEEEEEEEEDDDEEEDGLKSEKDAEEGTARAGGSGSGSDEDEDEDEGMDDEAMFRMDARLAEYLRSVRARAAGGGRELSAALLSLKLRVLALLEYYAKRCPASPLLPGCLPTLLAALRVASRPSGSDQLAARLTSVITDRFSRGSAHPKGLVEVLPPDQYSALARRVMYFASREPQRKVADTAGLAFEYIVKVGLQAGYEKEAKAALSAALGDLLSKKRSVLSVSLLCDLAHRQPAACLDLLPAVVQGAAQGRNATVRRAAWKLLTAMLKQAKAYAPRDLAADLRPLLSTLGSGAAVLLAGPYSKQQRQAEALKLLCSCLDAVARLYPEEAGGGGLGRLLDSPELSTAMRSLQQQTAIPKMDVQLARLQGLLGDLPAASATAAAAGGKPKRKAAGASAEAGAKPKAAIKKRAVQEEGAVAQAASPGSKRKQQDAGAKAKAKKTKQK